MKKLFVFAFTLIFCVSLTNAQDIPPVVVPEYGKVEVADLQLKDCSFSPGAPALNIIKYGKVELSVFPNGNTEVITITRCRTKIFNRQGYKYATIIIPVYNDKSVKIKSIQAATYNLADNGQVVVTPLKEEDIFKDTGPKKSSNKSIKFTLPDVKEGSVIEYQVIHQYKMRYGVPTWYLQEDIPTLLDVYEIIRPTNAQISKRTVGKWPVAEKHEIDATLGEDKRRDRDIYVARNVPAFKQEIFMAAPRDYKYKVDFLMRHIAPAFSNLWGPLNSWLLYYSGFGETFEAKIPGTKSFIDSVQRLKSDPEKIRAVYHYVKQKVKWMHIYDTYPNELSYVWKEGQGTSSEINLSILNLLRKCNVRCFPVLYSTRWHGQVDYDFPDLDQFNTVNIAVVNGKKFNLLDGTNPYLSHETPPFNVVNRTGLIIDPVNNVQLNVDFDRKLIWDSIFVSAAITPNGILKGKIERKYFDLAKSMKLQQQQEHNKDKAEDNDDDDTNILGTKSSLITDTSWQVNADNELLPLVEHSTFHYEIPVTNDFLFLDPFLFSNLSKNPFTDSTRISDIDFGASSASVVQIKIALPKEIKAEEFPKSKEIYNEDSSVVFTYRNDINKDSIIITSTIDIKRPIFEKQEYASIKKTFENIYSLLNNQILLRRKEEK